MIPKLQYPVVLVHGLFGFDRLRIVNDELHLIIAAIPRRGPAVDTDRFVPLLDEALVRLREKDREVVALRFFEQKSFKEIGEIQGTSEDSAQKRVSRALVKLRNFYGKHGVAVPA